MAVRKILSFSNFKSVSHIGTKSTVLRLIPSSGQKVSSALSQSGIYGCAPEKQKLLNQRNSATLCCISSRNMTSMGLPSNHTSTAITCKSISQCEQRQSFSPEVFNFSEPVRAALLSVDPASRYADLAYKVKFLRNAITKIAKVREEDYAVIPLNRNASIATEITLRTLMTPNRKKLIVIENGVRTRRIVNICKSRGIEVIAATKDLKKLQEILMSTPDIYGVMTVHCDPYSGYVNPIEQIGEIIKKASPKTSYIVDASLTFGGIPINMKTIDCLIGGSGKSLESTPGISFAVIKRQLMDKRMALGKNSILDLTAQYDELERSGRLLHTLPAHDVNALKEALLLLYKQGGVKERAARYRANNDMLKKGMAEIGFKQIYNDAENPNGYFTTAFYKPVNPLFVYREFQSRLSDYGYLLAGCENTSNKWFCICNIGGDKNLEHIAKLLQTIRQVLNDMRMIVPIQQARF